MALTQDAVFEKLKNVIDPELFVNIVDLGLIYEIQFVDSVASEGTAEEIADGAPAPAAEGTEPTKKVLIDMTMTSPACPAAPQLIAGAKKEVSALEGVSDVEVKVVLDPPWTPDRMTEDAKDQLGIF